MLANFFNDLTKAKSGERIVQDTFAALAADYTFEDVSDERQYYYKGDIKAIAPDGTELFIEVKTDSRIANTRNVLCEEEVYYNENDYMGKGNMYCDTDVLCVVSKSERKIYVIDFPKLKENYKKGRYKVIPHDEQTTYCYLCSLYLIEQWGALKAVVNY